MSLSGSHGDDLGVGGRLHALDPALVVAAVLHVDLAGHVGEVAAGFGQDEAHHDGAQLRLAAEVGIVCEEADELLRFILGDHEGSGADRLVGDVVAGGFDRLAAHHVAAVVGHEEAEQAGDAVLQRDLQRVRVGGLDRLDGRVIAEVAGLGFVHRAGEREGGVVGGEGAEATLALHAVADLEHPALFVVGTGPAFSQVWLDRGDVGGAGREADEAVEHPGQDVDVGGRGAAIRIERAEIVAGYGDPQRVRRLSTGNSGAGEQRGQG